jgi:hypothetical protein
MPQSKEDNQRHKPDRAETGAWTTGSGERSPETEVPPRSGNERVRSDPPPSDDQGGPETSPRGTDQESNTPGKSKPASEPAEDAPPNTTPGAPDN